MIYSEYTQKNCSQKYSHSWNRNTRRIGRNIFCIYQDEHGWGRILRNAFFVSFWQIYLQNRDPDNISMDFRRSIEWGTSHILVY